MSGRPVKDDGCQSMSRVLPLRDDVAVDVEPGAHLAKEAIRPAAMVELVEFARANFVNGQPLHGIGNPRQQDPGTVGRPIPGHDLALAGAVVAKLEVVSLARTRIPDQRPETAADVARGDESGISCQRRKLDAGDGALRAIP